jgi:hypothetical protein
MEPNKKEEMVYQENIFNEEILKLRIFLVKNCKIGTTKKRTLNKAETIFIANCIHQSIESERPEIDGKDKRVPVVKTDLALLNQDFCVNLANRISAQDLEIRGVENLLNHVFVKPLQVRQVTRDVVSIQIERRFFESLKLAAEA